MLCQRSIKILTDCAIPVPKGRPNPSIAGYSIDARGQISSRNDRFGVNNVQAMGEARTFKIAVDHRRDNTNLRQAKPGRDKIWCIFHEKRDGITGLESLIQCPMGDPVGALIKRGIGCFLALKDESDIVRKLIDRRFNIIGDQDMGIGIDILSPAP